MAQELTIRQGRDGSFSLWSGAYGEGFHSGRGALREARETFLVPSQLERWKPGERLRVLEVCVGTGCNLAVLLEACAARELELEWWGLELDPEPLRLALSSAEFRRPWQAQTLQILEGLLEQGCWSREAGRITSRGRMLWGDARQTLKAALIEQRGQLDLVWHDAFSPQHCPQLWTVELLAATAALLSPQGRWISYCSAAAVREALQLAGLQLVALPTQDAEVRRQRAWSGGTAASQQRWQPSMLWQTLSDMEQEHLKSSAGEPYRDPNGTASAAEILSQRRKRQAEAVARGERSSSSAWRLRWGVDHHHHHLHGHLHGRESWRDGQDQEAVDGDSLSPIRADPALLQGPAGSPLPAPHSGDG